LENVIYKWNKYIFYSFCHYYSINIKLKSFLFYNTIFSEEFNGRYYLLLASHCAKAEIPTCKHLFLSFKNNETPTLQDFYLLWSDRVLKINILFIKYYLKHSCIHCWCNDNRFFTHQIWLHNLELFALKYLFRDLLRINFSSPDHTSLKNDSYLQKLPKDYHIIRLRFWQDCWPIKERLK